MELCIWVYFCDCNALFCFAQVRTTVAVTHMQAGVGDNVLPQQGSLNLNFRLLPGDTPERVLKYLRSVIGRWVEFSLGLHQADLSMQEQQCTCMCTTNCTLAVESFV